MSPFHTTKLREKQFSESIFFNFWVAGMRILVHFGHFRSTVSKYKVHTDQTGGEQLAKTYKKWGSLGRKQKWQLLTDIDGVGCGID